MKKYQIRERSSGLVMAEFMAQEVDANTIFQQFFANGDCAVFQVNEDTEIERTNYFIEAIGDESECAEVSSAPFADILTDAIDRKVQVYCGGICYGGEIESVEGEIVKVCSVNGEQILVLMSAITAVVFA